MWSVIRIEKIDVHVGFLFKFVFSSVCVETPNMQIDMKTKVIKIFLAWVAGLFLSVASLSAKTVTVGEAGSGALYNNLKDAVDYSLAGDSVQLLSDITINESVSISRKLTIFSDHDYSIKKGQAPLSLESLWSTYSIYINADLDMVNVNFDLNGRSSRIILSDYLHFVYVNPGSTLRMKGTSSIRNSSGGAPLYVAGTVIGGRVYNNTSSSSNVGVAYVLSSGLLVNVVIDSNTLTGNGSTAVILNGGSMVNCTVVNNTSSNTSNTTYGIKPNGSSKITNCIVYGNAGKEIADGATVDHSCVKGGYVGDGNISDDPMLNGNFSLKSTSPCIDKGSDAAVQTLATIDYHGNPRISGEAVDMGASEYLNRYCEKEDVRISCGEPLLWIDGNLYTEDNNTAVDTVPGITCDTIVTLKFKIYPKIDKSTLTEDDQFQMNCPGSNVTFRFDWDVQGRTKLQWQSPDRDILSTTNTLVVPVDENDKDYLLVVSAPDGSCADSTWFTALVNYEIEVQDPAILEVDSLANKGCLLESLDLHPFLPTAIFCEKFAEGDTAYYYNVNGGEWIDYASAPVLKDVADGTEILWKMVVNYFSSVILEGETTNPVIVHVTDRETPTLICDQISLGKRLLPVGDSINGVVTGSVVLSDVLPAATDNCTDPVKVLYSADGLSFSDFESETIRLNVFEKNSGTIYWKVVDQANLSSDVCATTYEIERATEVDGIHYAIVRDTMVCSIPFEWHGHTFSTNGESAVVGTALLTVKMDSSYYQNDTVVHEGPYAWRNGVVFEKDTVVVGYRQENVGGCDSIYSLYLTITETKSLSIGAPVTPIIAYADNGCLLSELAVSPLLPSIKCKASDASDTVYQYQVNGGDWITLENNSKLQDVADGTSILWRVFVSTEEGLLSDETTIPQIVKVSDTTRPVLICDNISASRRLVPVLDSISGNVQFSLDQSDVLDAASDNCSEVKYWMSQDGLSFSEFTSADLSLNVFTQPSLSLYWKAIDLSNNESSVCQVDYSVEKNTPVEDKKYAIVRDTIVCEDAFPFVWHGHNFTTVGETVEVGAALLSAHEDEALTRYDTIVVCNETMFFFKGNYYSRGESDMTYVVDNGADRCDSIVYVHLVVHAPVASHKDTIVSSGCMDEKFLLGLAASSTHPRIQWYVQGELQTEDPWVGNSRLRVPYSGYDNYQYKLIRTTTDGQCSDTTVFVTNSTHSIESGAVNPMVLYADETCKATVRLRDYMPGFSDACSLETTDTICGYKINGVGYQYAGPDDYYTFEDGDQIDWIVGVRGGDGYEYTVTNPSFRRTVRVLDTISPKVDEQGISYLNRSKEVSDSVVGNVVITVPLSDVKDHISDNCDAVDDLSIQYSYDDRVYLNFSGIDVQMNVYEEPTKLVYYTITDKAGNVTKDTVLYRIERKSVVGDDSFAVVRDTMVCPSEMPYVWHGATFTMAGMSKQVGAAHLTVYVNDTYEKTDTVVVCDSYVWRDGNTYTESTTNPIFYLHNGENECDSLIHLNLTVLNPSSGKDSIVVCVKELPYVWNGFTISHDSTVTLRDVYGCDSLVDVKVVVLPIATAEIYDTTCVSYTLNGETYWESGVYTQTLTSNVTGCDSILTLHLVINDVATQEITKTVCGSYTLNDIEYFETGVYTQKLVSQVTGCDSIITLNLTVNPLSSGKDTVYVCEGELPIVWKNRVLKGDTVMTFVNGWGCDSLVDVKVIVRPVPVTEVVDTACGFYQMGEEIYTESSEYTIRYTSQYGCDSIVKLKLTILDPAPTKNIYQTACSAFRWNDSVYNESGSYVQQFIAANGCDSTVVLHLDILPPVTYAFEDSARGSYKWNDQVYKESGQYVQQFKTHEDCDSVVTLDLKILPAPVVYIEDTVCAEGMMWNGSLIQSSGVYSKHDSTIFGDDSITVLTLTVLPKITKTIYDTAYISYRLNDSVYTKSGIYRQILKASNGCDSTLILNLKIKDIPIGYLSRTSCGLYELNDSIYTETGRYEQLLKRADGTDSLLVLDLKILPIYDTVIVDTVCGSYVWGDRTYYESGSYKRIFVNELGCDSIVTLSLTVLDIPKTVIVDTACGSYVLNDTVYRRSGVYTQKLKAANGCDSLVQLKLTILKAPITIFSDTVCFSYKMNDIVYTESGTYEQRHLAKNGCDSIVRLNLVVLNSPTSVIYDTVCASYTLNGEVLTESTTFDKKFNTPSGCDSIVTVHLTILPIKRDTIYATTCGAYHINDSIYHASGVYEQKLESSIGCDSILTIFLNILPPTHGMDTIELCENTSYYLWHEHRVDSDTTLTITNSLGCDSIVNIKVVRLPIRRSEVADTSCAPYLWHGRSYMVSGDYPYDTISSIGCDSIVTLHLTILPSYDIFLQDSAVSYYDWNDVRYDQSGVYTQRFLTYSGCDSVVTKEITILPPPAKEPEKVSSCVEYVWQGRKLTESGIYYDFVKTETGEDSIIAIDLTIFHPKVNPDTIVYTVCESELPVEWNGFELRKKNTRVIIRTQEGCDSIVNIRLNILPVYDTVEVEEACDSFVWHGHVYRKSGTYRDTLPTMDGCDSTFTLRLTIKRSHVTEIVRTVCESELPIRWNEYEFYHDTLIVFPSSNGCDSIVKVDLTVNKEYNLVFDEVACGDFYWQGKLLTLSGTYVDSFVTQSGCDSIVTLNLVVSHPYYVELVDSTVAGTIYEKNGFTVDAQMVGQFEYEVMLKSIYGCDSLVHLSLYVDGRDIDVKWTSIAGGVVDYRDGVRWERKYCVSDEYIANYRLRSGVPDSFKITFDHEGIVQGLTNVYGRLTSDDSIGSVSFVVPDGVGYGSYKAYIQLFGEGKASEVDTLPVRIGMDARFVTRMWDDVVVFDNSNKKIVSYQWKKDNVDIPNANGQYYCEYTGLNGFYSLDVVTADNDTVYVCGRYFEPLNSDFSISAYASHSTSGRNIIYVKGLSDEELKKARLYVYTIEGVLTYWTDIVHKETQIRVRNGRYVCIVILEDQRSASCRFVSHASEFN